MVDISRSYDTAFVLRPDDVRKIYDTLVQQVGSVHFSAECSDGITRDFDTIEELDSYENPSAKAITDLRIRSRSVQTSGTVSTIEWATLTFSSYSEISILIRGSERDGLALRNDIEDIIDGMRPWHAFITRSLESNAFGFTSLFLWVVFIIYLYIENRPPPDYEPDPSIEVPLWGVAVVLASFGLVFLVIPIGLLSVSDKIQEWLFPGSYFALGRQAGSRYDKQEKFRWFFLTLISGIVVSLLFFAANFALKQDSR